MNLPTREEAKEAMKNLDSLDDLNALIILNAYASGTLIEARTEGEIYSIIHSKFLGLTIYDEKKLVHALVGKV